MLARNIAFSQGKLNTFYMTMNLCGGISLKISKKAIFYNAAVLAASNVILQILGFAYRIFISRATGAEGMGVYQLIFTYYSVVMAITLNGLCMAVSNISAEREALCDTYGIHRLVKTSIYMFLLLFAVVTIITLLFSNFIAELIGDVRTHDAILILLPCLFFTGFENIIKNCFYGIKKIVTAIKAQFLEQIVRFAAVAALLIFFSSQDYSLTTALIVWAMVISEVCSSSYLIWSYKRHMRTKRVINKTKNMNLKRRIIAIAVPVSIASLTDNIISSINTILLPRRLVVSGMTHEIAMKNIGIIFGMALPMILLPSFLIGSLSTILIPNLTEYMALNKIRDMRRKTGKAIHVTSLLAFLSSSVMVPLAPVLCEIVYNQTVPNKYLLALIAASFFIYFQSITGSILIGIGYQKKTAANFVIGGIIELVFTYFAGAAYGLEGFMVGFLISTFATMLLNMIYVIKYTGVKLQILNWFVIPAMSGIASGLFARFVYIILSRSIISKSAAVLCAAGTSIIIFLFVLKLQGISVLRYIKTLMYEG